MSLTTFYKIRDRLHLPKRVKTDLSEAKKWNLKFLYYILPGEISYVSYDESKALAKLSMTTIVENETSLAEESDIEPTENG